MLKTFAEDGLEAIPLISSIRFWSMAEKCKGKIKIIIDTTLKPNLFSNGQKCPDYSSDGREIES